MHIFIALIELHSVSDLTLVKRLEFAAGAAERVLNRFKVTCWEEDIKLKPVFLFIALKSPSLAPYLVLPGIGTQPLGVQPAPVLLFQHDLRKQRTDGQGCNAGQHSCSRESAVACRQLALGHRSDSRPRGFLQTNMQQCIWPANAFCLLTPRYVLAWVSNFACERCQRGFHSPQAPRSLRPLLSFSGPEDDIFIISQCHLTPEKCSRYLCMLFISLSVLKFTT